MEMLRVPKPCSKMRPPLQVPGIGPCSQGTVVILFTRVQVCCCILGIPLAPTFRTQVVHEVTIAFYPRRLTSTIVPLTIIRTTVPTSVSFGMTAAGVVVDGVDPIAHVVESELVN